MGNRRALCVGINKFKNLPTATLQGCVNDANDMALLLKEKLGFADTDITVLADAQATKAAVMGALRVMVDDAKAGKANYLVFSFSSHGTQIPDANGDEADKWDEAFCPYDTAAKAGQWDPNTIIVDDELHDLFLELPPAALLEVYLDTCHSGTGLKADDPNLLLSPFHPKPRWLPPPSYQAFEAPRELHALDTKRHGIDGLASRHHILWSGCRSDQTSADAHFDGRYNGAFPYYFVKAVRESNNTLTRAKIRDQVRTNLKKSGFKQLPQLEVDATNRNREIAP